MDHLRSTTFLATLAGAPAALALLVPQAALADTTISTSQTTPVRTSTAGNVTIASGGTILLANGGTAATVDSNNTVTVASGGAITNTGGKTGDAGIVVEPGRSTTISNAGTITVTETFTAADTDSNGIADGPIASASNRYGILVGSGATTTGSITNSGTIKVDGLNSGGIAVKSDLVGNVSNTGTINVIGDNSIGIATKGVTGNVTVEGTVSVVGEGAQAVVVGGNVGGTVRIQGTVAQASSYTTDGGTTQALSRTALRSGKAAVEVSGSVAGGILLDAPPYDRSSTSTDEDGDGVADASEAIGAISSVGNSPALLVGGANDIVIGKVKARDGEFSLGIDGTITASSVYSNTDAFAVVIGGQGGAVTMANGIGVSGTVTATTVDERATAILINQGSVVPSLSNSGTIRAVISSPGEGAAYAIHDKSGTLGTINNTGFITVTGSSGDDLRAIDATANTAGVTIKQYLNDIDKAAQTAEQAAAGYDASNPTIYAAITGDIHTGSGNDVLDVATGRIIGDSFLGAGNDSVLLSGDSGYRGDINFGAGTATMGMAGTSFFEGNVDLAGNLGTLTLGGTSRFTGTVSNAGNLDVIVNGGSFGAGSAATLSFDSLTVNSGGALNVYIDGEKGTASQIVVNTATFASGSKVSATISSLEKAEGSYTILTAGSLEGTPTFDATTTELPVLFNGDVSVVGETLVLDVSRKTAQELGLTAPQSAAYEAIYAQATATEFLGSSLLQVENVAGLQGQFDQLLPDYAGGVFDFVTRSARLASRHLMDDSSLFSISNAGGWLEPMYFRGSKDETGTAGFKVSGWGISTGFERHTGIGNLGLSFAYTKGDIATGDFQTTDASNYELGAFWRMASGPFYAYAKASVGRVSLSSTRNFTGAVNGAALSYAANGSWKGWTAGGQGGASYKLDLGSGLSLRPMAKFDYFRLSENGYTESGSDAIYLEVAKRTSSVLTGTGSMTASWSAGDITPDARPLTVELEGGYRSRLAGKLGDTVANFEDGDQFRLTPDAMQSGWTAEARVLLGGMDYTWQLAGGAEQIQGTVDYSVRGSLSIAF
ncbi:autotransporter domain-containing protein [Novosphingobium sp. 17-62-19]|uniref:autotransporter domain-containing protein n=1 Tax=Novosphingobium sp. 17-62-19 TaxID=1970406 RepID=UPI0025F54AAC|nr:autotransporter domain-containing protein [Novosphingobium sp. 17-62-19]HQS96292.1 autotransporter domain-containing protein [Novosphingobium sp.]